MDYRFAMLMALIANTFRDHKKTKAYTAADFLPKFEIDQEWVDEVFSEDEDEAKQSKSLAMLAYVEALNAAMGGKDMRAEKK